VNSRSRRRDPVQVRNLWTKRVPLFYTIWLDTVHRRREKTLKETLKVYVGQLGKSIGFRNCCLERRRRLFIFPGTSSKNGGLKAI